MGFLRFFQFTEIPLYELQKMMYNTSTITCGGAIMNCLRCGRKVEERQVFCPDCLEEMEKYPVKPGVIRLPVRSAEAPKAKPPKGPTAEEQLAAARRKIQSLRRWIAALALALVLCAAGLGYVLLNPAQQPQHTPRNYTTAVDGK